MTNSTYINRSLTTNNFVCVNGVNRIKILKTLQKNIISQNYNICIYRIIERLFWPNEIGLVFRMNPFLYNTVFIVSPLDDLYEIIVDETTSKKFRNIIVVASYILLH